jgi:hypothetical protein
MLKFARMNGVITPSFGRNENRIIATDVGMVPAYSMGMQA